VCAGRGGAPAASGTSTTIAPDVTVCANLCKASSGCTFFEFNPTGSGTAICKVHTTEDDCDYLEDTAATVSEQWVTYARCPRAQVAGAVEDDGTTCHSCGSLETRITTAGNVSPTAYCVPRCTAGKYPLPQGGSCRACPAGTYFTSSGGGMTRCQKTGTNAACRACPEGKYQDQTGQNDCHSVAVAANRAVYVLRHATSVSGRWNAAPVAAPQVSKWRTYLDSLFRRCLAYLFVAVHLN
jgi:hypothetical protein